ncbi:MAG TPA: hypothetical protein VJR23_00990 [Candidatus Acidoferrales bacterium]|nr:hypothetical protein [Candidatus Acidoferrales bacterium]
MNLNSPSLSRNHLLFAGCLCLSLLALAAAAPFAASAARPAHPGRAAVNSGLSPDKGKFRILVNGAQVGTEQFEISAGGTGWTAKGTSEIHPAQGPVQRVTATLQLHADGTPGHYEWSSEGAKKASSAIDFSGTTATAELHLAGMRPYTQTFTFNSPLVLILDNNLYHQYIVLARLYDWSKGGAQSFPVLVPQELTPGTVTVDSLGQQDVDGKKLDELRVKTEDNEIDLYLENSRLVRIVAPSANAEIDRE